MGAKKIYGIGKTYVISKDSTENPKLCAKVLATGRESLYLEYYMGYKMVYNEAKDKEVPVKDRKRESLKLYLWQIPRSAEERNENKETLELAKRLRFEREQELKNNTLGYRLKNKKTNFFDYLEAYYSNYTKADIRMIKCAKERFEKFIAIEYPMYGRILVPERIDEKMMACFVEYLRATSKGLGAVSHWKRWKKIVKAAVQDGILKNNPCDGIICRADEDALTKAVLSVEEIQRLMTTEYKGLNPNIRRAFLFTLYTGIRFCDIKELSFENVDRENQTLTFNQNKTKDSGGHSFVTIPLNDGLLSIIGEPSTGDLQEHIFKVPSSTMCLKALRNWTEKAGIKKHITWHCGRHSFATNILTNGANIKTVAALLGHSSVKYTEKYVRAVDSLKQAAINSLPEIKL